MPTTAPATADNVQIVVESVDGGFTASPVDDSWLTLPVAEQLRVIRRVNTAARAAHDNREAA